MHEIRSNNDSLTALCHALLALLSSRAGEYQMTNELAEAVTTARRWLNGELRSPSTVSRAVYPQWQRLHWTLNANS